MRRASSNNLPEIQAIEGNIQGRNEVGCTPAMNEFSYEGQYSKGREGSQCASPDNRAELQPEQEKKTERKRLSPPGTRVNPPSEFAVYKGKRGRGLRVNPANGRGDALRPCRQRPVEQHLGLPGCVLRQQPQHLPIQL